MHEFDFDVLEALEGEAGAVTNGCLKQALQCEEGLPAAAAPPEREGAPAQGAGAHVQRAGEAQERTEGGEVRRQEAEGEAKRSSFEPSEAHVPATPAPDGHDAHAAGGGVAAAGPQPGGEGPAGAAQSRTGGAAFGAEPAREPGGAPRPLAAARHAPPLPAAPPPGALALPAPVARGAAEGAAARHLRAAEDFAALLLQMRGESPGGCRYLSGMRRVFRALSACQKASPYREKAEPDATATCLLATLARDCETLRDPEGPAAGGQHEAFMLLERSADAVLEELSGPLDHLREAGGDWMLRAVPADPDAPEGPPALSLFQRLVHLPLVMYVRNTVHLYEMLDRLKAQADGRRSRGQLRRLLDGEGSRTESPYSWLVFGILGALQALLLARQRLGWARFPSELLASSPPHTVWARAGAGEGPPWRRQPAHNCEAMHEVGHFRRREDLGLMYRGIWLPAGFGEEQMRYQYSFQSFSRSVQGVMRVLRFYSSVDKTRAYDAAASGRLLLYVARRWPSNPWVTPVQFFDGPKKQSGDSEEELLLPPFMQYSFEEEFSIDEDTEQGEKAILLAGLQEHWGVELPTKLVNFVHGSLVHLNHTLIQEAERPGVAVRFIRAMAPAAPVARLFSDGACLLYRWRAGAAGGAPAAPGRGAPSEARPWRCRVAAAAGREGAPVRDAPSHRAAPLGALAAGEEVLIAGCVPGSPWLRLASPAPGSTGGYVHRALLEGLPAEGGVGGAAAGASAGGGIAAAGAHGA